MEEILKSIAEAEEEASKRKEAASKEAADILSAAEEAARKTERQAEADLKTYRLNALHEAEESAEKAYSNTLALCKSESEKYADEVLKNTAEAVKKIVGRVLSDR